MSTIITTSPNGETIIRDGDDFLRQNFKYTEPKSYKEILTDTTPVYEAQDISQKQTIESLVGKINSVLQQEVRSDECKQHADNGETHYVPEAKMKDIWKQVEEKFGKRADAVKKRLLKVAGKNLSQEGYIFECEQSNTEQPDKWKLVRDVKNVGKSFLDKWLEEGDDDDKVRKNILKPVTPEVPESEGGDVILPDSVQIPRQPQPEQAGTEE